MLRRNLIEVRTATLCAWGDSAFSNAPGKKRQYGYIVGASHSPDDYLDGRYDKGLVLTWQSATVKRVVRSTQAAEAYATTETLEAAQFLRHALAEIYGYARAVPRSLRDIERGPAEVDVRVGVEINDSEGTHQIQAATDAANLSATAARCRQRG